MKRFRAKIVIFALLLTIIFVLPVAGKINVTPNEVCDPNPNTCGNNNDGQVWCCGTVAPTPTPTTIPTPVPTPPPTVSLPYNPLGSLSSNPYSPISSEPINLATGNYYSIGSRSESFH